MSASIGKRILKWSLLIAPWVLTLILAAGWGLSLWTPDYLERLIPTLTAKMGIPLEEFHIRNAGLFSADIGPVQIGPKGAGIRLDNVRAEYSPAALKMKRVKSIVVHGIELGASYDGQILTLPLLDLFPAGDAASSDAPNPVPVLPFDALVVKDSSFHLDYQGHHISIPFSGTLTPGEKLNFSGVLRLRDQAVSVSGELGPTMNDLSLHCETADFQLGSLADLLPLPATGAMDLDISAVLDLDEPDKLKASLEALVHQPECADLGVTFAEDSLLAVNATVTGREVELSFGPVALKEPYPTTFLVSQVLVSQQAMNAAFTVETSGVTLPCTVSAQRKGEQWDVELLSDNSGSLRVETGGRSIHLAGLSFSLKGVVGNGMADMVVDTSSKGMSLGQTGIRTGRVKLSLPVKWPAPKKHLPGTLSVSNIRHGKRKLGSVWARLRQEDMGVGFGGTLASELLPGLRVAFSGNASMEGRDATLKFKVPQYALPEGFDPAGLVPALGGIAFTGNLSVEGGVDVDEDGIESHLGMFLTNGSAVFGESGTAMRGIRVYFESPDLMNFHSSPAQMFAFDSLTANGITVEDGVVTFQLEPGGVTLVERGRFKWCDGFVESRAFRVVPGLDEYDVTLFCTNLKLTQLLHQLGLAKAKGDSALSGELPVTWKRGQISFNGGFLHSTPGEGGIIQVEAMEDLVDSIPKGTPQRGQLELARAAIKDFEYKWVRIKADTVGRDLLVRLSVDGRPVSTLPFVYKKEFGGFAMVEGDVKGSNFQGLRLDVNFSLPLDRILLYKDLIERIE